jgi:CHAD domain-containing protein
MKSEFLKRYVHANKKVFGHYAAEVQKKTSEESVHKLRVSIRRISSVSKLLDIKFRIKSLRNFGKSLGELRDLDVALINAHVYGLEDGSLKAERKKIAQHIHKDFSKEKIKKMIKEIKALEKKVSSFSFTNTPQVEALKKDLNAWRKKKLTRKNLHSFRIIVKKVRYILEATGKPLGNLKRMQDLLGELHDLQVLTELLGEDGQVKKDFSYKFKQAAESFPTAVRSFNKLFI